MRILTIRRAIVFLTIAALSCSETTKQNQYKDDRLADIIATFGFHVVEIANSKFEIIDKMESLDRDTYAPISFERARIRSYKELDGWHGPTIGNFYLAIENYRTEEEATKRAADYRDWKRFAAVVGYDDPHDLGKTSGRCWAYPSQNRVYLLSSHAAIQSALEDRTNSVLNGIKAYEKTRLEQTTATNKK